MSTPKTNVASTDVAFICKECSCIIKREDMASFVKPGCWGGEELGWLLSSGNFLTTSPI